MTASKLALALIAGSLSGAAAASTSLTAQEILEQFNLVALGDVTAQTGQSHVGGRSYIGGNLTADHAVFAMDDDAFSGKGSKPKMADSVYTGLTVYGNATSSDRWTGLNANNNGAVFMKDLTNSVVQNNNAGYAATAAVLGTSTNATFNVKAYAATADSSNYFNGGKLSTQPASVDAVATPGTFSSTLNTLSDSLSVLKDTGGTVDFNGYGKVTFTANSNGLAVFDLTKIDAKVFASSEFEFKLGAATTVIFNVDDTAVSTSANFLGGSAKTVASNVIWNFYNATSITLGTEFGGSILGTDAKLTNYGNIEGVVMVNTLDQRGEIHYANFTGTVPSVPEPETYAMMLGGLALMAGIARRRRAA